MAEKKWAGTTFGNGWMHRELIRMLKYLDVRVIYAFMAIFITPGCLVFASGSRIIYRYFRRMHGKSVVSAVWGTYKNLYLFGQVVVDRFASYAGKKFDVEVIGYDNFYNLACQDAGFLQLSAHIGNYEMAGYSLVAEKKRFNALIFGGEKQSIMQNRDKIFKNTNINMICVSEDMSHLFEINNALANGEIVSMPADRHVGSQKSVEVVLLGKPAKIPYGPFSVATSRGVDVIAVNVMKSSSKAYKIYVTSLPYDKTASRQEQIRQIADAYVQELERMLTMYPEQWYNYYEFWD